MREEKNLRYGNPKEYIGEPLSHMRRNTWLFNFSRKLNDRMKSGRISALTGYSNYFGGHRQCTDDEETYYSIINSSERGSFWLFEARDCERFLNTEPNNCFTCFAEKVKSKLWNRNPKYFGIKTRPCGISEGVRIRTLFEGNKTTRL